MIAALSWIHIFSFGTDFIQFYTTLYTIFSLNRRGKQTFPDSSVDLYYKAMPNNQTAAVTHKDSLTMSRMDMVTFPKTNFHTEVCVFLSPLFPLIGSGSQRICEDQIELPADSHRHPLAANERGINTDTPILSLTSIRM